MPAMNKRKNYTGFKGHRFPSEIIEHAVWPYFRFSLSLREGGNGSWAGSNHLATPNSFSPPTTKLVSFSDPAVTF